MMQDAPFTPMGDTVSFLFLGPETPVSFSIPKGATQARLFVGGSELVYMDINRDATVANSMPLQAGFVTEVFSIPQSGFLSFCSQGTPKVFVTFGNGR